MKQNYEFGSVTVNLVAKTEEFEKQIEQAKKTLKTLDSISAGRGLENYFLAQEELVERLTKAYKEYIYWQDQDTAEELIKSAHALQAMTGELSSIKHIDGLGDISKELAQVEKQFRDTSDLFSADKFRDVFEAIYTVRSAGLDVNEVFEKFKNQDTDALTSRIRDLESELEDATEAAKSLRAENSRLADGTAVELYKKQVSDLNTELTSIKNRAASTFRGFLTSNGLNAFDEKYSNYFKEIREGGKSALQVMAQFRAENKNLFENVDGGEALSSMFQVLLSTINQVEEGVKSLASTINEMNVNGVKTVSDAGTGSMRELASALLDVNQAAGGGGGDGPGNSDWLRVLIEKLTDFATIDVNNLSRVATSLSSIASMNGLSITKTPINNITVLLDALKTFGKDGRGITIPDFSKLNNLAVDENQLKTLSSYLPKIAKGDYAGLHELEGITFDNLKNLSLENSVASIKAIASLTRALNGSDLSSANAFLTGLDFSKIQNVGVDEKLGAFATALSQLSKVPFEPLKNILSLSFQNLNSIDIKENAAQSIELLAKSLTTLSGARDELQQIIDFVSGYKASGAAGGGGGPIISPKLNDELDGAKRKLESISAIYDKTKEQSQQLVGYTKNYVAELDKYIQKSHDIYKVDYDEDGTPTETLVTRNILDSLVEKEKLTKKAEQADIKANITTQNLIRTVNSYAATLEKSSKAASQAGLEDDQRVVGLNKIIQDLHALSLMIESASPDELLDLREVLSGIQVAGDKAKASVDGIVSAEKEVGKNTAALREEETAFVRFDTAISNLIAKYKAYVSAAEEANLQDNESVKSLQGYISALENLQSSANTPDSAGIKEFNAELVKIDNNASKAAKSVQSITTAAMKDAANEAKTQADTIKAIARYETIRKQIINDINKSSKAEHGKSLQDYNNLVQYRDAVEQLYQEYTHGSKSLQDFRDGLENIANGAAGSSNNIRQAGEMTTSFGDRIKKAMGNLSTYFGVSRMIMQVVRYTRDLIKTSIELDKEMGQLRIVTDETEAAYSQYADTISDTAKTISASMTDLISATTTFARLGYSLDESSALAKYTAMLQQVGDIDASAAQNAITAITKAFANEVDVNNIESVMDRLVKVGRMVAHVCSNAYLVIGYNGQSRFGIIA